MPTLYHTVDVGLGLGLGFYMCHITYRNMLNTLHEQTYSLGLDNGDLRQVEIKTCDLLRS